MSPDPEPSLAALASRLRDGSLSCLALTEATLGRIAAEDGILQSFAHISEHALAAAERADAERRAGRRLGALHGVPLAIKDNFLTADMPTAAGTSALGSALPRRDATVVRRLREAGAILVGKTRMHEYAWGNVTPPTRNPWDVARVPGGSSGGTAAAIAAGFCAGGMGSDTGGSVRIPASLCGIVGLKPTFGRIGRGGIVPHSWSLDHPGPMTRNVEDAALMLTVIAGHDIDDPGSSAAPVPDYVGALGGCIADLRIGVCRNHFFGRNQPDVEQAIEAAIAALGSQAASVEEFELPNLRYGLGAIFAIELASSGAYHEAALRAGRVERYADDVRLLVEMGRLVTGVDYIKAEQLRRVLMEDFRAAFTRIDVIVGPCTPLTAWRSGEWTVQVGDAPESVLAASWRLTYPYNLTGLPAISLPCGLDRDGLPIGLQIAGRPFDEATVLRAAMTYERIRGGFHELRNRAAAAAPPTME